MSQESMSVTYSLEDILKQINQKLDNLQKEMTEIKIELVETRGELKGKIKALDEKVEGLSKRIDNQEFVNRGILVALVVAILGSAAKLLGWVGNP